MDIFWELHCDIPREGPGDNASTRKAYALLNDLPKEPRILDVACGPGMQTIELAKISAGYILAVDTHQPFLDELNRRASSAGLSGRISTRNQSMFELDFEPDRFDVIWSEGAIYILGFERGLREWKLLLKTGGYLAVTELSWLKPDPPAEIKAYWNENYPGMKMMEENLAILQESGYQEVGHFILPESSWWDDYYTPLEKRIVTLSEKYQYDEEAMALLRESQRESDLYQKYSSWYGYVFYIMQK
jgi:ubiquinone/menaquinone biosynthesis C-methylase UbiE